MTYDLNQVGWHLLLDLFAEKNKKSQLWDLI